MKCKCIADIERRMKKNSVKLSDVGDNKIERVRIKDVALTFESFESGESESKTYSTFHIHVAGRKSPIEKPVLHNFCPWCGEKYVGKS